MSIAQQPTALFGGKQVLASNTGAAGSSLTVTLPGATGLITYLTNVIVSSASPAAQVVGVVTISDGTFTLNFQFVETTSAGGFMDLDFVANPIAASGTNIAITITIPAIAGGAVTAISAVGFQR